MQVSRVSQRTHQKYINYIVGHCRRDSAIERFFILFYVIDE